MSEFANTHNPMPAALAALSVSYKHVIATSEDL